MTSPLYYKIYINPLENGSDFRGEIDVTDDCGVSSTIIKMGVDKEPYDIGSLLYDDLSFVMSNAQGLYSGEQDSRSIFRFLRDRAKVRIEFHDTDGSSTDVFKGFVDELGTVDDVVNDEVKLSVLSLDSVLRRLTVNTGTINQGMTFKECLCALLDRGEVTSRLNFDPATDIEVGLDLEVDSGTYFDDLGYRQALDALLTVSGSVLTIDLATETIKVRPRSLNAVSAHALYGPEASSGTQNVIGIKSFNKGFGRMFNKVRVNNISYESPGLVDRWLSKLKNFDYGFLTDVDTELQVATFLVGIFGMPAPEVKIEVPTSLAKTWEAFDPVTLDWPLRSVPAPGQLNLPLFDQAVFGTDRYPMTSGSYQESPVHIQKLIGSEISLANFITTLRLVRTY